MRSNKQNWAGKPALTTTERQRKRNEELNQIARAHGFQSWAKFATACMKAGRIITAPR